MSKEIVSTKTIIPNAQQNHDFLLDYPAKLEIQIVWSKNVVIQHPVCISIKICRIKDGYDLTFTFTNICIDNLSIGFVN